MKILFVCTGNTCRSPMAEGILSKMSADNGLDIQVKSAGIFALAGGKASEYSIEVMSENGMDISKHTSSLLTEDVIRGSDLILTMTISHKMDIINMFPFAESKTYTLNEYAFNKEKNIADPYGGRKKDYQNTYNEIYVAIENIVKRLKEEYTKLK